LAGAPVAAAAAWPRIRTKTSGGDTMEDLRADRRPDARPLPSRLPAAVAAALAAALAAVPAGSALAQAAAAPDTGALEEVVVTAQKRAESLQSVPVSVTALTGEQLGALKLSDTSAIAQTVPNLQVNGIVGESTPVFSLRGVSMFDYSFNQSSPVAAYLDEVYKGNFAIFGVELYDVERVEVLRGPQGTLYGKNTTGGAINFITRKPTFDTNGYIKAGFGNYNRQEVEGALNLPVVADRLAIRVAATYTKADGWFRNVLPGKPDLEGVDQWGARVSVLWKATDSLEFILRHSRSKQNPYNYGIYARPGPDGVGFGVYDPPYFRTNLRNDQIAQDYTPKRRQDVDATELTTNWSITPKLTLTAITSYDHGTLFNPEGTDGSPIDVVKIPYFGRTNQVTQDLRLTTANDGPFNAIFGAYYQHEKIYNSTELQIFTGLDVNGDGVIDFNDCALGFPAACKVGNSFDQIRNSWAAYTDMSFALNPEWKLRAGLRYNHDNGALRNFISQARGVDNVPVLNLIPGDPVNLDATLSNDVRNTAWTGRLGVDWTPTQDLLAYASYSRGYRSGAFSAQAFFSISEATAAKPETIDSIEVGLKSKWADGRVQLNGALFHYQYKNQQIIDVQPDLTQPLKNLDKSKIDGGELELVARPVRPLTLRLGLGWLDAKLQDAVLRGGIQLKGNKLPNAPDLSGTFSADWEAAEFHGAGLLLHVDGSYVGKQFFEPFNLDRLAQPAYTLVNARVAVHGGDDRWEVAAWGKNLTDKFYLTTAADLLSGFGFDYFHRGAPRTYGMEATYRFR
jgi:iron complex outermembrane receptor protein